ncbi:hypothetical protein PIB30_026738 [Stylosanthes scabra]|uniref:Uncharacterized protein n=1 Tax=Stylosanthes scabra TaxID=79078 RepID=A0ABU6VCM7_9FABA|nr:hypothetical protein [Stylosanthes scabra]
MAPLTALVHYNGHAIENDNIENNLPYDGPKPKAMTIKTSFTLETLKLTLHKKLDLSDNVIVGRMAYRIQHAVDVGKWQLVDVDDNIACIFDMHAVSGGLRTMYLYVEPEMGENLAHTPFFGRTINTQSSQASTQRGLDNSTPNPIAEGNRPTEGNPLMKDILSDISDHEDEFLNDEQEDEDIAPDQPFEGMHGVGDVAGHVQALVACPPSFHAPPSSLFSDINGEAMEGASKFLEIRSDAG